MFDTRESRQKFYTSKAWSQVRQFMIMSFPLCQDCEELGITTLAEEVHHIKELKDWPDGALDPNNLRCLCKPCHSRITMTKTPKPKTTPQVLNLLRDMRQS